MRPDVYYQQFDLSQVVSGVAGVIAGTAGNAKWGEVDKLVLVSSSKEFVSMFLPPVSVSETPMHYQAFDYFVGAKTLYVVRPQGGSKYGGVELRNTTPEQISSLTPLNAGADYGVGDELVLQSTTGTGCHIVVTSVVFATGAITGYNLTAGGQDFVDGDSITQTSVTASTRLKAAARTSGGSNYTVGEVLNAVSTTGSGARIQVATVDGSGAIQTTTVIARGSGYANADALTLSTYTLPTSLKGATIVSGGENYNEGDAITVTSTNGLAGTVTVASVDVNGVILTVTAAGGSGFVNGEALTVGSVNPAGGTGATFTAIVGTGGSGAVLTATVASGAGFTATGHVALTLTPSLTGYTVKALPPNIKLAIFTKYPGDIGTPLYIYISDRDATTGNFTIEVGDKITEGEVDATGSYYEKHKVSCFRDQFDGFGRTKFMTEVFARDSKLLDSIVDEATLLREETPPNTTTAVELGGSSYVAATAAQIVAAYNLLIGADDVKFDLIFPGSFDIDVINATVNVTTQREDCFAVVAPDVSETWTVEGMSGTTGWLSTVSGQSWRVAAYASAHYQKDIYNDRDVLIPSAGAIAGSIAKSMINYAPWYAPFGRKRGPISVKKLYKFWSKSEKDILYDRKVNFTSQDPSVGPMIDGQKTLNSIDSSLSSVNVALLILKLRRDLMDALGDYKGDFVNDQTMTFVSLGVNKYLSGIKTGQGLYDYRVVCDGSNNTDQTKGEGKLIVDIYIKPTLAAEYIYLRNTIASTGVDFSILLKTA